MSYIRTAWLLFPPLFQLKASNDPVIDMSAKLNLNQISAYISVKMVFSLTKINLFHTYKLYNTIFDERNISYIQTISTINNNPKLPPRLPIIISAKLNI